MGKFQCAASFTSSEPRFCDIKPHNPFPKELEMLFKQTSTPEEKTIAWTSKSFV